MRKFGQLLGGMIWQNITVIISVGIIHEIFGLYGWWYNEKIFLLVNPIYHTLLPILLGYTGGKLLGGQRGAVVASIVIYGLTLSSSAPVILGAMIVGPLIGWIVQKCDQVVTKKVPVGYELLVGNVAASLIAVSFTIVCFLFVGQVFSDGVKWSTEILEQIIYSGWLPLTAVIIEPAKVFFFNNPINYGVLAPLGIQQAKELGKSIFFLLESNPGPGLGVLLAYWLKTKAEQRKGAQLALFIQFFGGIHEVYFPYVLRKPMLILSLVMGGMTGIFMFQLFDVGAVSLPSPGSIFLFLALVPKEDMVFILFSVLVSALISFCCSFFILDAATKSPTKQENLAQITALNQLETIDQLNKASRDKVLSNHKVAGKHDLHSKTLSDAAAIGKVEKITFVCEAGLGSSAMGAAMLKRQLKQESFIVEVDNASVDEIPENTDLIICHQRLLSNVQKAAPEKVYYPLHSFTDMEAYKNLIDWLKNRPK